MVFGGQRRRNGGDLMESFDRIVIDACMMGGKPCIKGTRLTVDTLVGMSANPTRLFELFPDLTPEDLQQAVAYAAWKDRTQTLTLNL